jgi:hypothetical protein
MPDINKGCPFWGQPFLLYDSFISRNKRGHSFSSSNNESHINQTFRFYVLKMTLIIEQ